VGERKRRRAGIESNVVLLFTFGFYRRLREPNPLLHEDEEGAFHGPHASGDEDEEERMDEVSSGKAVR
jgi:hypothetical protein